MKCEKSRDQICGNKTALIIQDDGGAEKAGFAPSVAASKSAALAGIMRQPAVLQKIGPAWPLYFRLALVEGGRIVGDYRGIGEMMGTPQSTVEKWIAALINGGIAVKRQKGRGIEIELLDPHLAIARMPDQVAPAESPVVTTIADSETKGVLTIMEGARLAGGSWTISVTGPNGTS